MNHNNSLKFKPRTRGSKSLLRTVLVVCGGEKTESDYIDALKLTNEIRNSTVIKSIDISNQFGVDPDSLVDTAISKLGEYDEVWCMFDIEDPIPHPSAQRAIARANKNNIRLAISNPCFELWLILHDQDQFAHISTENARRLAQKIPEVQRKKIRNADSLVKRRNVAILRAENLRKMQEHNFNNSILKANPRTDVDLFVQAVGG